MKLDDLPLHYNAIDILEHNLVERADKVALYSLEREMTFRQVSREVNQVGHALWSQIEGVDIAYDMPEFQVVRERRLGFRSQDRRADSGHRQAHLRQQIAVPEGRCWPAAVYLASDQLEQTLDAGIEAVQIKCGSRQEVILVLRLTNGSR